MPPKQPSSGLPLEGKTFVFTAEMESLDRETAKDKIKTLGGKATDSVSGKTSYLVAGSRLEGAGAPGTVEETSKYRKAESLIAEGKPLIILREQEFLQLLEAAEQKAAGTSATGGAAAGRGQQLPSPMQQGGSSASSGAAAARSAAGPAVVPASMTTKPNEHIPWVLKYAPKSVDDLQGHQTQVKKLREWLRDWDDVVLRGNKKPAGNFRGQVENVNARGALITGPPGIGKTTAVKIVCEEFKDTHVAQWYNASDSRGKKAIDQLAMGLAQVAGVDWTAGATLKEQKVTKRTIIVMDEADGMGAGDRMGTSALAKLIQTTSNPVICIANDGSKEQKMRTLASKCYDLKFFRPIKTQIAKRVAFICAQEGIRAEPNALEALAEATGNDLRQVITQCQALAARGTQTIDAGALTFANVKDKVKQIEKDMTIDGFGGAKKLLDAREHKKMNFHEQMDAYFADYDLVPLLVQENYIKYYEQANGKSVSDVAFAADLIAQGDYCSKVLRKENAWSLLPDVGLCGSVYPTAKVSGFRNFPDFPQWLGKNSSANKSKRVVKDLSEAVWKKSGMNPDQMIQTGFAELLYTKIIGFLKKGDIPRAAAQLDKLGLTRDHLAAQLSECRAPFDLRDEYKLLDTDVKKKLGLELKKPEYTNQPLGGGAVLKRPRKEKKEKAAQNDDGQEHDEESESEEESEVDDAAKLDEALKAAKAKPKGKAKAKGKAAAKKKTKT
ncbi:unnamed protein product [Amoebophrya sp. A120]|nr:unnamed protein product [Amoebophrya sp. A120]|eukprot:GSA120T00018514001.1